jgi:hypothetical protein
MSKKYTARIDVPINGATSEKSAAETAKQIASNLGGEIVAVFFEPKHGLCVNIDFEKYTR